MSEPKLHAIHKLKKLSSKDPEAKEIYDEIMENKKIFLKNWRDLGEQFFYGGEQTDIILFGDKYEKLRLVVVAWHELPEDVTNKLENYVDTRFNGN